MTKKPLWASLVVALVLALVLSWGVGFVVGTEQALAQGSPAQDPPSSPAIVSNDIITLGINPEGNLGAPGGQPSSSAGTQVVGMRFGPTGNEAISAGDTQESWGVADAVSGSHGHADESDFYFVGKHNATTTEFSATDTTARSVVGIGPNGTAPAPAFEVTHEFRPSPFSPNLYEALVTVRNTSTQTAGDVRYRRVVDWDVEPTPFSEIVTVGGDAVPELLFSSNDGFANPNPLGARTGDTSGLFANSGPYDQGATFDLGLGSLGPAEGRTFKLFYGAAPTEAGARSALTDVGADFYSLAKPDVVNPSEAGSPNMFVLGFLVTQRAPAATADTATTEEDVSVDLQLLQNDTDLNSDALTVASYTQPEHGTVVCEDGGECNYAPDGDWNGADTFTYVATDGKDESNTATVSIDVSAAQDAPTAEADAYSVDEDATLTVPAAEGVLANDADVDGDALMAKVIGGTQNGTLALQPNGSLTYKPNANYNGPDEFTYQACDDAGLCSETHTATITVAGVNDAPVAGDDTSSTDEDQPVEFNVRGNDEDADGDALTIEVFDGSANGTAECTEAGICDYTPEADFNGEDSFTYTVRDGNGGTDTATVTITVRGQNDAPVAEGDAYEVDEDGTLEIEAPGVLENDADIDGNDLTAEVVDRPPNGALTFNEDGSFVYRPDADFNGEDSFTYRANDGRTNSEVVTVTITVRAQNDAPQISAVGDQTIDEDGATGPVEFQVSDAETAAANLEVSASSDDTTLVADDAIAVECDGAECTVTVTPAADRSGTATITLRVTDAGGATRTETFVVTVTPRNDAPDAVADSATTSEDAPVETDVLDNDSDADGDAISVDSITQPDNGTVTRLGDGTLRYEPDVDFNGEVTFTYTVVDGNGGSDTATVTITVSGSNDAPAADDDDYTVVEDGTLQIEAPGVLAGDTDIDRDALTAGLVEGPSNGTLTLRENGSFVYAPDADFNGEDSFTYRADDGPADSNLATVTITVRGVNDAPVADDEMANTGEDAAVDVDVLAGDADADGDDLAIETFGRPENGTVARNQNGTLKYTPRANYNGSDTFEYTVTDGKGATDTAVVSITVRSINDAPVASDDDATAMGTRPASFGVLDNDSDVEGDQLSVSGHTQGANGAADCTPEGRCTYTASSNVAGEDSFTYTASDGNGGTATGRVTVRIEALPPAPETTLDSGPSGTVTSRSQSFSFSSDKAGARFECSMDGAAFAECPSPQEYADLSDGPHTFEVRAVDGFDQRDVSPARREFTVDATAPTVVSRSPQPDATDVPCDANIVVGFSETLDPATVTDDTFILQGLSGGRVLDTVPTDVTYDPATKKATLDPISNLRCNATYHAVEVLGTNDSGNPSVRDEAGNPLAANVTWAFETADTTAPSAPDVHLDAGSDSGASSTDNITNDATPTLTGSTQAGTTVRIYNGVTLLGTTTVGGPPYISGVEWTFIPAVSLTDGSHRITVTATDAADNVSPASDVLTVTVDTKAPTISSVTPTDGARDVGLGVNVRAVFADSDIDPATINTANFQLFKGTSSTAFSTTPMAEAPVTYDASTKTATLNPRGNTTADLAAATWYKAVLKGGPTGVRDKAGNPLPQDKVWTFRTRN